MKIFTKTIFIGATLALFGFLFFYGSGSFLKEPIAPIFFVLCAIDIVLGLFFLIGLFVQPESLSKIIIEKIKFVISIILLLAIVIVIFLTTHPS